MPATTPSGYRHGTRYAYRDKACRCVECRAWNAALARTQYAKRRGWSSNGKPTPIGGGDAG